MVKAVREEFRCVQKVQVFLIYYYRAQFNTSIRDQILFEVASELELSVISLSSTAEGYRERIDTMKDDISQLERWDGNDEDFEDLQEVIQILRRCCIPRNGKGRLT